MQAQTAETLEQVSYKPKGLPELRFLVRNGSSDEKSLKEVVTRNAYARRDFPLRSDAWVDLGANIGAFTVLVAVGYGAKVRAYEPDPASYALLERNVELNGIGSLVELYNLAVVADDRATVPFHVNSANKNYWRNSVVKTWRGGYTTEVPATHIDEVLSAGEDCKMDIEGAEMPILEAMSTFPRRMTFEWSFDIDRSIPRFAAVVQKLRKHYANLTYAKFDETKPEWASEWFPPCRTVWCW